jgi:tellurite resistance protein TehA-like permease
MREAVLKPRLSAGLAVLITFLPVGFMLVGAFFLFDDTRDRWSFALVWAGRQGLYIVLGMHVYALWCFVIEPQRSRSSRHS